ncbi:isochorismatase family cysteine hydrolase [Bacillus sp. DTU_2020_1000418_1_SI_GHA_SEK_038]|uniref:cysteine hydrolase family protein n=1 Tax=Bacillus sp. DTU_2020_1000418_1_SI_GHA_SEK_038 TaxID=3077585 RepID=UPI0028E6DB5A|nr:isochorismatase family cysteine hydrolase [Bacillus sp. DTU_2020_1000418_1_SI_GHA_SEK_038]WNS75793.1 isochorismatase family cysteine hydrolase [Bacillus sp. DTU_2020_1000418_1_SI_GHA_SEK_038]
MDLTKTALLLIDLQKESGTSDVVGMNDIVQNARALINACRMQGIPIIYTRHIGRADGIGLANKEPVNEQGEPIYYHSGKETIEIIDEIKPQDNDIIIDKYRYSGFYESSLDLMLKSLGIKHLIIGGVLTDCCVMATVLDAYYRDYQVNLIKDICGTTTVGAHMASILMLANWIYDLKVYDTSQIENKLLGKSHHVWESEVPDQLQFTPENVREVFGKLSSTSMAVKS